MAKKEKWVSICPKCGSTNVSPESNPVYMESGLSGSYKQCENCGHHGLVFPQVPQSKVPKKTKPLGEIKNCIRVQTGYGEGYWKYLIYLIVPLALLTFIFWSFNRTDSLYLPAPLTISMAALLLILGLIHIFKDQTKSPCPRKPSC
jgi:hypothetical protein